MQMSNDPIWHAWAFLIILAIPFLIWIWALIDIIRHDFKPEVNKIIWLLLVAFLPVVGFLLYIFMGRKQRVKVA